jgi:RNA polymerase sigma-70 factor (ECF subfamily)
MSPKPESKPIPQEAEHIARAQKGDKDAFRVLVEAYQDRVFSMVLSMVRHREQAEDLTQEIFVKVYFALPTFKGDSAFYTWLFRISSNYCVDYLRKHRPVEISLDQTVDEGEDISRLEKLRLEKLPAPAAEHPETPLESEGDVVRLLDQLSPDQRLILTLREAQGHSYEELATMLKCSVNTIKSRLNRAREALKLVYSLKYGNISNAKLVEKGEGTIT